MFSCQWSVLSCQSFGYAALRDGGPSARRPGHRALIVGSSPGRIKCEPAELFLFDPKAVGKSLKLLDARVVDFWRSADERTQRKAIRILSELL